MSAPSGTLIEAFSCEPTASATLDENMSVEKQSASPGDTSAPDKPELLALVRPWGQEHLLAFWDELSPARRGNLAAQLRGVDFALIARLYQDAAAALHRPDERETAEDPAATAHRAEPPPAIRLGDANPKFSLHEATRRGAAAISAGKLGVVLVAGGQGTRLGFDHPKGLYKIGPVSGAPLFQILIEKLVAVGRRHGVRIPLYLMTSPATHDETLAAMAAHDRFGLAADDLHVFCQGTMPAVDAATGRLLLEDKGQLALSPDGHGGMLAALEKSGALADIQRRRLEQLFYMQVDNPLAQVCDRALIGYHLLAGSELSTQVVAKRTPLDRVGNVALVDGKLRIIEYSDLPDDAARARLPDGSLKLWAGNIAVHVFDVAFLARRSQGDGRLPFHIARKKVAYIDASGQPVEPSEPNAVKFEQFIFDLLPAARNAIVVEVDEATAFAPLKNAPGEPRDSPEMVRAQLIALHRAWLREAGAVIDDAVPVEISPLFALDATELRGKIEPGLRVNQPRYFH
jgi:UDP-N-acetylglucosamine/UDP-N-acetylgalactosamine diphosphorylase